MAGTSYAPRGQELPSSEKCLPVRTPWLCKRANGVAQPRKERWGQKVAHSHALDPQSAMRSPRPMYRDGTDGFCGNMQNSGDAGNTIHKGHLSVWPRKHLPCVMDAIGFHAA